MKKIYILFAASCIFFSCGKETSKSCNSNSICYTFAPDSLFLKLDLSYPENLNLPTKVKLYKGNMDDGILIDQFQTTADKEYYYLPVREDYTATAEYVKGKDTILAIDNVYMARQSCEDGNLTCYDWDYVYSLDLKLKN